MAGQIREVEAFITDFLKEIEENNAAVFAGAGLSAASGHVDWKALLKDFADELGLDIDREHDLVALTQFHLNRNANNRHTLNQKIANEFHRGKNPNENHVLLASLPIQTWWTTNYDKLIEKSLEAGGKIVDVKYTTPHLAKTIHGRDAILYKMHGDVDHPDQAIIARDQYEKYYHSHGAFINTLSGDLVSKTFLFIGFSFTDPNLDYILSRVRVTYQENQRKHYCFFREVKVNKNESEDDFRLRQVRQDLLIHDLKRFNIQVLKVKEYEEITSILREIVKRYKSRTVYISGSAYEYGPWGAAASQKFVSDLSRELIRRGYKIVSGFGLGIGSHVINGVLEELYLGRKERLRDQLLLRPFPQGEIGKLQWDAYRKDMISHAGIAIFLFGNKLQDDKVVLADGVQKEFDIAHSQNCLLIPVGTTGYQTFDLWKRVSSDPNAYSLSTSEAELIRTLGDSTIDSRVVIKTIIDLIEARKNK